MWWKWCLKCHGKLKLSCIFGLWHIDLTWLKRCLCPPEPPSLAYKRRPADFGRQTWVPENFGWFTTTPRTQRPNAVGFVRFKLQATPTWIVWVSVKRGSTCLVLAVDDHSPYPTGARKRRRGALLFRVVGAEWLNFATRPGKHTKNYGKSPCLTNITMENHHV